MGHIVANGQIAIDPDKMKAVTEWPVPFRNVTEVQSFLGLVGYYRKFIPHFSHLARYLNALTHKNVDFKWTNEHTDAVKSLKNAIVSPDCLVIFDSSLSTTLTTDACDYALGAMLMQKHPQGDRPIAFISRMLTVIRIQILHVGKRVICHRLGNQVLLSLSSHISVRCQI